MFKQLLKYPKKYPLLAGLIVVGIYFCCKDQIANIFSSTGKAIQEQKAAVMKKEMNPEPEMIDSSMFNASIVFNQKVANVDAQMEDIVNEAHQ